MFLVLCGYHVLQVNVKKIVKVKPERELAVLNENGSSLQTSKGHSIPTIRKSKLLIVDLAGSERINKSGLPLSLINLLLNNGIFVDF